MGLFKKFSDLFKFEINTGPVDPDILALLTGYRSSGLTSPEDKASLELAETYFDYRNNRYVNCYRLFAGEDELILIDRKYSADSRRIQGNAILLLGIPVQHAFELTDDGANLFSPDIRKIGKVGKLSVYFDSKEAYQRLGQHFQPLFDLYDRFNCGPISFFSNPQMNILGYHVNGRMFEKQELDNIIQIMKELKHKNIGL
jgi:hypothetical protein